MTADVRFVLEVQDIDPSNPATLVAPATVLYDGVIASAPGFCTYALVDAMNMQCSIAYTYVAHIPLPEVRTALPDANYVTQLVGARPDGGECDASAAAGTLNFYRAILAGIESAHCGELSRFWAGLWRRWRTRRALRHCRRAQTMGLEEVCGSRKHRLRVPM